MKLHLFISKCNLVSIAMRTATLRALNAISEEQMSTRELAKAINLGYRMTANLVKALLQHGYVIKSDEKVKLASTTLATLFSKISKRYDTVKLLGDSREEALLALLNSNTIQGIQSTTGLSYRSIRRALTVLMEIGAVEEKNKGYAIVGDRELQFFLTTLKEERQRRLVEPYAEIVYASPHDILKRVPLGKGAKGSLTAFSIFSKYGVELRPVFQYFIQPERELSIEEVLLHAIVFSANPVELTDCAVFYVKNRDLIDLRRLREISKKFSIDDLALDLENYVRNLTTSYPERFLPWDEFAEKARLYGASLKGLRPPAAYPNFFDELAKQLGERVNLYLFGGEAMRIRGLKRATADVDIVLDNERVFLVLGEALRKLGYTTLTEEISKTDAKLNPSEIFVKEDYPRVDLFIDVICNAFHLSDSMKKRCEIMEIQNLRLCIMSNEDLFLLKSITEREGDIHDMIDLARARGFDWRIVFEELEVQEEKAGRHFCLSLLDSIETIEKKTSMKAPFYNKLVNHCIDQAILESVAKWRATTPKQIREFVNYPDYRLRSRINRLIKEGRLAVSRDGKFVAC